MFHHRTARIAAPVGALLAAVAAAGPAWAWGHTGHVAMSQLAIQQLPADLPAFVRTAPAAQLVGELGAEADESKTTGVVTAVEANGRIRTAPTVHDAERDPGHYIDIDDNGFILGGAVAHQLSTGFVPIRKKGKLPGAVMSQAYVLEYGEAVMEIHDDALSPGERVLIVDDLLATGGTAEASISLCKRLGAEVVGTAFVVDLPELGGRRLLEAAGVDVHVLCEFEGA